ncbi:MAG TPA: TonB-dependent receptor [Candidatus Binatia bacterium]|nr:TonB-dependent receptor [Candidatus Binatia bacterium]
MRSRFSAVTHLFLFLIAMSTLALGQSGTTSLRGTVTDPSQAAVAGAKVTLASPERGFARSVMTNATGNYEFLQLQPGNYQLTVEMSGFRKSEQQHIQLLVDTPSNANVKLEVGTTNETVEVSGEAPVLNTTDASVGNAFSEIQVKSLPMEGRNVPDLLSLQAGVAYTGNRVSTTDIVDTRSGAVNGARSDQSNITLDGVDVNDNSGGDAFTSVLPITADSVQEFRVTTSNYNSDEGHSSGAQVSLITKSGTNNFHGALYEYHRNTITSANDYFVKQSQLASGEPNRPLKLIRNIFGAAVGGPIIKDRLFFFANYEGARQREEQSALRVVPTDALRDGVMMYQCSDPSACPASSVQGASQQTYAVPDGFFGLSPTNLIMMDPVTQAPKGPNAVMLQYFQGFPHPNDNTVGYGVNFSGYRFKGPIAIDKDWYIARVDYRLNASGTHTLYWRGGLRNDTQGDVPYLTGTPPLRNFVDYSKGFAVGYSATLSNTLLNTFRWGYTRQSLGIIGNNNTQPFILFRTLNNNEVGDGSDLAIVRSTSHQLPIHNLIDDISWSRGKHTLQFGTNIGFARQPQQSFVNSFSDGQTNASWLDVGGMATTGLKDHMDPGAWGFPTVSDAFAQGYDYPLAALLGMVTEVDAQYNFQRSGAALPEGAAVNRRFAQNYYEFYGQDTWKVRPNLTVTFGLRYSLFSPPWETNGLQVAPTISLSDWFNQRRNGMLQGIPSNQSPLLSFDLAGPANGKAGFYHWDKKDFAPRLAIAWSPEPKTTIRAGFGMVYDHLGQTLLSTFDQQGSFGMSTSLSNLGGQQNLYSAPRLTGLHSIPTTDYGDPTTNPPTPPRQIFQPSPGGQFPTQFPPDAFQVYWGMDDKLRTPYSYMLDFSVGHQLQHGFAVQATYVGRLARRLLTQSDLAMPLDLVDPKTGLDYYKAIRPLSQAARNGVASDNFDPSSIGAAAQYWADVIQPLQPGGLYTMSSCTSTGNPMPTTSAAQAVYDLNCPFVGTVGETTTIQALDQGGIQDFNNSSVFYQGIGASEPNAGTQTPYTFLSPQFASLYAWRSNSNSSYHALQLNFRKTFSQGVQFDFNYTFSKSIDLASDAQRIDARGGLGGQVINVWDPNQHRGVSDFDTTHQINLNWIAELPFGRGKMLGHDSGPVLNAVIGGWELSGVARWTSGFPTSVGNGANWPTNWELSGFAETIGKPQTHKTRAADGSVNLFSDPLGPNGIGAFRADFPGESGQRNILRGDGFAGLDLGLSKIWKVRESQGIRFQWQVFNTLNLTRFNVATASLSLTNSSTFGNYTSLLTSPRVMQFALRYEF